MILYFFWYSRYYYVFLIYFLYWYIWSIPISPIFLWSFSLFFTPNWYTRFTSDIPDNLIFFLSDSIMLFPIRLFDFDAIFTYLFFALFTWSDFWYLIYHTLYIRNIYPPYLLYILYSIIRFRCHIYSPFLHYLPDLIFDIWYIIPYIYAIFTHHIYSWFSYEIIYLIATCSYYHYFFALWLS